MCTAATYLTKDFYMGRTLDYEFSYGEQVTVMPRGFELVFRHMGKMNTHFAMIGMAHVTDGYPLFYEAFNEKGVGMAGLNFVGNAVYAEVQDGRENVAQFEFIPWVLGQCSSVGEVRALLERINLVGTPYNEHYPCAQLHWLIADSREALTVESMADDLHVYENPVGVLTNNPPFPLQMFRLNDYMRLSVRQPQNLFSDALDLKPYSRNGRAGAAGGFVLRVPFCPGGVCKTKFRVGDFRGRERESVFPYFRRGGTTAGLL